MPWHPLPLRPSFSYEPRANYKKLETSFFFFPHISKKNSVKIFLYQKERDTSVCVGETEVSVRLRATSYKATRERAQLQKRRCGEFRTAADAAAEASSTTAAKFVEISNV